MKHLASLALLAPLVGCTLPAQEPYAPPPPFAAAATSVDAVTAPAVPIVFSAEQLDQLLGPIALYPDALIALMLPASTNPSDIVFATRYLQQGGDLAALDAQPWDESIRALAHYPEVIKWMDQNLAWTKQLGDAFTAQAADVMNAIQRLRLRARDAGTLVNTPQQQIVYQDDTIAIVPTQPDVIYVPYYDPAIVYVPHRNYYSSTVYFGFSSGFAAGWWLSYGLDWRQRCVWEIDRRDRERYWQEHQRDWHRHYEQPRGYAAAETHRWQPHPEYRRPTGFPPTRPSQFAASTTWSRPTVTAEPRHDDSRREDADRDGRSRRHEPSTTRPSTPSPTPAAPTPAPAVRPPMPTPSAIPPVTAPVARPNAPSYPGNRGFERNDHGPSHPDFRPSTNPRPAEPSVNPPNPPPQMRGTVPPYGSAGVPPMSQHRETPPARPPAPAPQASPSASSPSSSTTTQTSQSNDNDDNRRRPPPFIRTR